MPFNPLDFLASNNANANDIPASRVLSSQASIKIGGFNGGYISLGEVDNFSARKSFKQIKKWKPFGFKHEKILLEDEGWDLSFSFGKTDWKLSYLVWTQENILSGNTQSNKASGSDTFNGIGTLYNKPIFYIDYKIYHHDGVIESYQFEDVVITNFDFELTDNNSQIPEKLIAWAPSRVLNSEFSNDPKLGNLNDSVKGVMDAINSLNRT